MKSKFYLAILLLSSLTVRSQVIITQYYEGLSNNKWIEITNIGETAVDLSSPQQYLCLFSNANADNPAGLAPTSNYTLTGSLVPGSSLIFKNSSAVLPAYASGTSSAICNFNGDDLVILSTSNATNAWADRIDVVGNGESWGENKAFYRKATITTANINFTLSEWTEITYQAVDAASSNQSEYLGYHIFSGSVAPTVANPVISPSSGTYTTPQQVTITCETSGSTIYYTTDGSTPTVSSTQFTDSFTVNKTSVIKAIAYKESTSSAVSTASYTIEISSTDANLPYVQHFTLNTGNFTTFSSEGTQAWRWDTFDNGCMVMSGFAEASNTNTDWLISPTFNLSGKTNLVLNYTEAINYLTNYNELQLVVSTNYTTGDPTLAIWTPLTVTGRAPGNNWTFAAVDPINLNAYAGNESVTIAFKYTSTAVAASTWEIGKVSLTGDVAVINEPSNHVTGFTAVASTITQNTIELSWTENQGNIQADGYLIKAGTASPTVPTDGLEENDDTDLTDGFGQKKLEKGSTGYTFENCSPSTTYYFSIYPFSGNGSNINYKTENAPTASAKTLSSDVVTVLNPEDFNALTTSSSQIDLTWKLNNEGNSVLIAFMEDEFVTGTPSNSATYGANDTLPGGGIVLFKGNTLDFQHQSLIARQFYGYKIWSVNNENIYSTGIDAMATTLAGEPSNHVTNFKTDSVTNTSIYLSWNNATGETPADGYYLTIGLTGENVAAPVDFSEYPDDKDLSDGIGGTYVDAAISSYVWSGLKPNQSYSCYIYPHTDFGTFTNYKTDGAPGIVTTTLPNQVSIANPVISPIGGLFNDSVWVEISCSTEGASIYYTLDGSTPTTATILYTKPFKLTATAQIKAIAILNGSVSEVISGNFEIQQSVIVVSKPAITPNGGTYIDSVWIEISCVTAGATLYYTTQALTPDVVPIEYTGKFKLTQTATISAIAVLNNVTSEPSFALFTVNPTIVVAKPTFSPGSKEFETSMKLAINCSTPGASIYYTIDGNEPEKTSTIYTDSISITKTTTVKAIAFVETWNSVVAEATYTLKEVPAPIAVSTLAELRSKLPGTQRYTLTGEAVVTFGQAYRGQKWIQDATGAILVDDPSGIITENFTVGEGLKSFTGTLLDYYGLMEFLPTESPVKVASPNYQALPQIISMEEFTTNFEKYESELIQLERISIDATGNFATAKNYTLKQGNNSTILRTHVFDVDYIGKVIPSTSQTITGVAIWHFDEAKIIPRSLADFKDHSSNPIVNNEVSIGADDLTILVNNPRNNQSILAIYDISGRLVHRQTLSHQVSITMQKPGIYLVNVIHENGDKTMKKLILKENR